MYLCGCKLSTNAPFCDAFTCQQILKGEKFEPREDTLYLQEHGDLEDLDP